MDKNMTNNCSHTKDTVGIVDSFPIEEIGSSPPRFWTILGECKKCGKMVEIEYEFKEINE